VTEATVSNSRSLCHDAYFHVQNGLLCFRRNGLEGNCKKYEDDAIMCSLCMHFVGDDLLELRSKQARECAHVRLRRKQASVSFFFSWHFDFGQKAQVSIANHLLSRCRNNVSRRRWTLRKPRVLQSINALGKGTQQSQGSSRR